MAGRCGGAAERKLGRGAATCGAAGRGAAKFGIGRTIGAAGRAIGAGRTIAGGGAGRAMGGGAAGRAIGAAPTPGGPCPRGWAYASIPATSKQVPRKSATKRLPRRSMFAAPVIKPPGIVTPMGWNRSLSAGTIVGRRATNWLDGQITSGLRKSRQACSRKIFRFSEWQIRCINCPSPRLSGEDETRSSRIVGAGCDGRLLRQPGANRADENAAADGEVVWSWRRDRGVYPVRLCGPGNGDKNRRSPGRSRISRKPSRGESRDVSAVPV